MVGESRDAPLATWPRTESIEEIDSFPIFVAPVPNDRLIIHRNPLFRTMIPFDKNASLPSQLSATMLNDQSS